MMNAKTKLLAELDGNNPETHQDNVRIVERIADMIAEALAAKPLPVPPELEAPGMYQPCSHGQPPATCEECLHDGVTSQPTMPERVWVVGRGNNVTVYGTDPVFMQDAAKTEYIRADAVPVASRDSEWWACPCGYNNFGPRCTKCNQVRPGQHQIAVAFAELNRLQALSGDGLRERIETVLFRYSQYPVSNVAELIGDLRTALLSKMVNQ